MDVAEARRSSSASSSTEFQFWPLDANPTASPSCADELFAGGVLLPLPVLPPKAASHARSSSGHVSAAPEPDPEPEPEDASLLAAGAAGAPVAASGAAITSPSPPAASAGGGSKRWTDIFSKKPAEEKDKDKEKRKDGGGGGRKPAPHAGNAGGGSSELNINIWPFSRSRSAGGGSGSSKPKPPPRKASSAPCSRSNSRGEAAPLPPRRWAASPGRAGGGVPVGRSSPVWQIRRPAAKHAPPPPASEPFTADRRAQQNRDKPAGRKPGGVRGLNLSVNSCIGYQHQVSCRRADAVAARAHHGGSGGLFGIKGFFSKKVH